MKNLDQDFESHKSKVKQIEILIRQRRILEDKIEEKEELKETIVRGEEIVDEVGRRIELPDLEREIQQLKLQLKDLEAETEN